MINNKNNLIYVVIVGRVPGIYFTKEDMQKQVANFVGGLIWTFTDIEKAIIFYENSHKCIEQIKEKKKKKEKKEKNKESSKEQNKKLELKLNGDITCFIDCEADNNIAISLGAVFFDLKTNTIIDKFYSTIKPKDFVSLTPFCKKLTGLTDEEINNSKSFNEVFTCFSFLLDEYKVTDIFSWGNQDKRFLKKCSEKEIKELNNIVDIQIYISMITSEIIYNKQWSLQTMKSFLNIPSKVVHNALSDALDLCNIYIKWKEKDINVEEINKEKLKIMQRC